MPAASRGEGALAGLERLEQLPPPTQRPAQRPASPRPVPKMGGRSYRRSIRSRGPVLALLIPAVLGVTAVLMLRNSTSTARGLGGFVAAVLAAPLLPTFGAPIRSGGSVVLMAIAASVVLWLVIGVVASRRAAGRPLATWGAFWSEYLLLAMAAWAGVVLSIVLANLVLGRALL
jgi:hypothetical protein